MHRQAEILPADQNPLVLVDDFDNFEAMQIASVPVAAYTETLADYEGRLQKTFHPDIRLTSAVIEEGDGVELVLPATYVYSNGYAYSGSLAQFLRYVDPESFQVEKNATTNNYHILVANDKLEKLKQSLAIAAQYEKFLQFSSYLFLVEKDNSSKVTTANTECLDSLDQVFFTLMDEAAKDGVLLPASTVVLDHFAELVTHLDTTKKKMTVAEVEASMRDLDRKLYGKPPLRADMKVVICGLVGALIGCVLGVAIGGVATSWSGGWGALPAAVVGAVKGFTVGTAVAAGSAGLFGAGVGSAALFSIGFFGAANAWEKQSRQYHMVNTKRGCDPLVDAVVDAHKSFRQKF